MPDHLSMLLRLLSSLFGQTRTDNYELYDCYNYNYYYGIIIKEPLICRMNEIRFKRIQIHDVDDVDRK